MPLQGEAKRLHQHELACMEAHGGMRGSLQMITALFESHIRDFVALSGKFDRHLNNPHSNGTRRMALMYTGGGGLLGGGLVIGIMQGILRLL